MHGPLQDIPAQNSSFVVSRLYAGSGYNRQNLLWIGNIGPVRGRLATYGLPRQVCPPFIRLPLYDSQLRACGSFTGKCIEDDNEVGDGGVYYDMVDWVSTVQLLTPKASALGDASFVVTRAHISVHTSGPAEGIPICDSRLTISPHPFCAPRIVLRRLLLLGVMLRLALHRVPSTSVMLAHSNHTLSRYKYMLSHLRPALWLALPVQILTDTGAQLPGWAETAMEAATGRVGVPAKDPAHHYKFAHVRFLDPASQATRLAALDAIAIALSEPTIFDFDPLDTVLTAQMHLLFELLRILSGRLDYLHAWHYAHTDVTGEYVSPSPSLPNPFLPGE
ncbi:hypothetical protein BJY52DRAFT_1215988 [Lactarius psammicola]|nr:hypothetical protein BJY52DRAFT_1215988 [Lactarius psammicola]